MKYKALMSNWAIIKDIIIRALYIRDYKQLIKDIIDVDSHYYLMIDENGNIR